MKRKILVVEDEIDLCQQIEKMLATLEDVEVVTANTGTIGLEQLRLNTFNAVVTDVRVPGLDGLQLLAQMRAMGADTPVILISGAADKAMAIQGIKLGACDFIEKPFRAADILQSVEKALSRSEANLRHKLEGLDLSQIQIKILEFLFTGAGNKEIAGLVHLSEQGVKYHIGILFQKFETKNRADLKAHIRTIIKSA